MNAEKERGAARPPPSPRFTAPRRRVLDVLEKKSAPLTAYDIVRALGDAKPMTVYRALDFLAAEGLVHRIETLNAYVPCRQSHCAHEDSQYAVCDSCGAATELHDHTLNRALEQAAARKGFSGTKLNIEIHGTCAACAGRA